MERATTYVMPLQLKLAGTMHDILIFTIDIYVVPVLRTRTKIILVLAIFI